MPTPDPTDNVLDNVVEITSETPDNGDDDMPESLDIDQTSYEELVEEGIRSHDVIMQEHEGNAESSFTLVNHAGGQKFAKLDPIEAAATEMILQLNS